MTPIIFEYEQIRLTEMTQIEQDEYNKKQKTHYQKLYVTDEDVVVFYESGELHFVDNNETNKRKFSSYEFMLNEGSGLPYTLHSI